MLLHRCGAKRAVGRLASGAGVRVLSVDGGTRRDEPHKAEALGAVAELGMPFELSRAQARDKFNAWCSRKWLHASDLWDESRSGCRVSQQWLPFWAFSAEVDLRYRGVLGFPTKGGASPRWQAVLTWAHEPRLTLSSSDAAMQVYASYDLRRDFVVAAVTGAHVARAVPLAHAGVDASRPPFAMPRSLAWRLAQRPVEQLLRARATAALLGASPGATEVRDLELEVHFTRIAATPVRLPAYVLSFTHGTTVSGDQSIVPERFTAVVGAVTGRIGCTELLSPRKAQLAAASPLLLLGVLGELFGGGASLSVGLEAAFLAGMAGLLGGLAAQRWPYNQHTQREAAVLRECDAAGASSPSAWMDERAQRSRDNAEWLRWEKTGLWGPGWDPKRRQEWAQTLFRAQVERARGRATRRRQDAEQAAAAEEEAAHRDPLGYYQVLGLPAARVGVATDEEIKAAYLAQAQVLHPDKHTHGDVAAAADAFRKLQAAYSTLRDANKRAVYLRS